MNEPALGAITSSSVERAPQHLLSGITAVPPFVQRVFPAGSLLLDSTVDQIQLFFLVFACFVFNLKLCIFLEHRFLWYRYREMIDNGINVSMPPQERRFYLTSLIFTQIVTIVILLLFIRTYVGSHLLEKYFYQQQKRG